MNFLHQLGAAWVGVGTVNALIGAWRLTHYEAYRAGHAASWLVRTRRPRWVAWSVRAQALLGIGTIAIGLFLLLTTP